MGKVDQFVQVAQKYADRGDADFIVVYLREAHPTDGWMMPSPHPCRQHIDLDERLNCARILRRYVGDVCPVVVDCMRDEALHAYAAFPERLCILIDGKVAYEGALGPYGYDLAEMEECLVDILNKRN